MPPKQINPHYRSKHWTMGNTNMASLVQGGIVRPGGRRLSYTFVWFNDPNLTEMHGLVVRRCLDGRLERSSMMGLEDARRQWESLVAQGYTRVDE